MGRHIIRCAIIGWLSLIVVGGCSLKRPSVDVARGAFLNGNLELSQETLHKLAKSRSRAAEVAALDLAIVHLASGETKAAEQQLRRLRDKFDSLPSVAPIGAATSMLTDDNARKFRPAGYEEVMIRAMLSVCSLAGDATDAESYALQAAMKQEALAKDAAERGLLEIERAYQPIALAPYLRGVLREATHHDYDDAVRAYQLVSHTQPNFAPAIEDIARASGGTHSQPGHGVLYVIALVGRGPIRTEKVAETTSAALSIASSVFNAQTNEDSSGRVGGPVLPNIAQVKVPDVEIPQSSVQTVGVRVGGVLYGATQTLTDVGQLAINQVQAEMPWTIARAVVRRATKETIVAGTRDALGVQGAAGSMLHFAASTAWSMTENADTRCWGLLPREIQVLRAELPIGTHPIHFQSISAVGGMLPAQHIDSVEIVDGRNTYKVIFALDQRIYAVN